MADRSRLSLAILFAIVASTACGPGRVILPSGTGTPTTEFQQALSAARLSCERVNTMQAELGLSGRAAGQRVRGRIHAGLVPQALRLEAVAPFGSPVFILVADGSRGTLLLLREQRVLRDAPPEEILNALIGVKLGPDDLRATLSGCVKAVVEPSQARAYGTDWMVIDLASGGSLYLRRQANTWRIVAGRFGGLEVDYTAFEGDRPLHVVLRGTDLDVGLSLQQVEINGDLPRDRLVAVTVPAAASPFTLDELRKSGPLAQ